jgi:hypothetical protein
MAWRDTSCGWPLMTMTRSLIIEMGLRGKYYNKLGHGEYRYLKDQRSSRLTSFALEVGFGG